MFILVVKLIICANKNIINWSYEYENEKKKLYEKLRGHTELNHGPLDLQSNALPLSYTPSDVMDTVRRNLIQNVCIVISEHLYFTICV